VAANVPASRTSPYRASIVASESTRSRLFRDSALLLHWVRAHGLQLIPAHRPAAEIATTASETLYYKIHPSGRAVARVWVIGLRQSLRAGTADSALVDITFPDGVIVTMAPAELTAFGGVVDRRLYVEELTAKSGAAEDVQLFIEHTTGTTDVYIETVACFEMPRSVLTLDEVDRGVDLETLRPGAPMYAGQEASVLGLAEGWGDTRVQRTLWSQALPLISTASESFVDCFPLALPVTPARRFSGVTTALVEWWARGLATDGTTAGEIRMTAGSGDTSTVAMPTGSASLAWLARGVLTVDCEDLADAEGMSSVNGQDALQLAFRRTAGSGSVRLVGIHARQVLG